MLVSVAPSESVLEAVEEQGCDTEVEHFFARLVSHDEDVAGLDENPFAWIHVGFSKVHFDRDLPVARCLAEDEQGTGRHESAAADPTHGSTAATACSNRRHTAAGECEGTEDVEVVVARDHELTTLQQATGIEDFGFTRLDVDDISFFEDDILRPEARHDPWW